MTLPASPNSIAFSQVNDELGIANTTSINLNMQAVRNLFGRPTLGSQISMSDGRGKQFVFRYAIASSISDVNLRTNAISAGWNQNHPLEVTINSGVQISSTTTASPAMMINGSFPQGVTLINNGHILGRGGNGGRGRRGDLTDQGGTGFSGGPALQVQVAVTINNGSGTIAGGGGGGGGGGAGSSVDKGQVFSSGGGGGGGGRSSTNMQSTGGLGGNDTQNSVSQAGIGSTGANGNFTTAGAGGAGSTYAPGGTTYRGQAGGAGGNWGTAGSTGVTAVSTQNDGTVFGQRRFGLAGGSAGNSVTGVSNITWISTGTRLGPIV